MDANQIRGLVEGPDQLLYAVTITPSPYFDSRVLAIDNNGIVEQDYIVPDVFIEGNIGYGQIAFANNGQFFVSGANDLVRFTPGSSISSVIFTANDKVLDVVPMPSGNLLVLADDTIDEITTDGVIVRTINPSVRLVDGQGLAYDAITNDIYVTMLGQTGET
jgi:hypothetical protein